MPLGSSKNRITLTFFSFFYCRANGKSFPISIPFFFCFSYALGRGYRGWNRS